VSTPAALDVLRRSEVCGDATGGYVKLPAGKLDRSVYTEVDKILKAIGGKWSRGAGVHLFARDPRPDFETITKGAPVEVERIVTAKKTFQAFYTPAAVADRLVQIAAELSDDLPARFLEPSAGDGAIVKAILRANPLVHVTSVETRFGHSGFVATFPGVDFLTTGPSSLGTFDAVIMNPPFTKGQDVQHVLHAWDFVRPGGVLVAIVSPAFRSRAFGLTTAKALKWNRFRRLNTDRQLRGGVEIDLPAGTFKESGTNVAPVIVGWVKPDVTEHVKEAA